MNKNNITKRLSRDTSYVKTKNTYQDKLSPNEIKKKLEEYKQIDDITSVPLNSHVRYFTFNPKTVSVVAVSDILYSKTFAPVNELFG